MNVLTHSLGNPEALTLFPALFLHLAAAIVQVMYDFTMESVNYGSFEVFLEQILYR
jgi:hypothetical protein